jgi:hypothetical protein
MTRTELPATGAVPSPAEVHGLARAPVLPPPRRRRRPALLALAVSMVVLGALGATYLATSLGQTTAVIAIAREVPWGQTLTAADLVEARISADPALEPIPYVDRDQVIGLVAAATLRPGSLLTRDAVTDQRLPPPGQQLVGVGVSLVQLPTTPLRPGDEVLLVPVTAGSAPATTAGAPSVVEATVVKSSAHPVRRGFSRFRRRR